MEMFTALGLKASDLTWSIFLLQLEQLKCLGQPASLSTSKLLKLEKRALIKEQERNGGGESRRTRDALRDTALQIDIF